MWKLLYYYMEQVSCLVIEDFVPKLHFGLIDVRRLLTEFTTVFKFKVAFKITLMYIIFYVFAIFSFFYFIKITLLINKNVIKLAYQGFFVCKFFFHKIICIALIVIRVNKYILKWFIFYWINFTNKGFIVFRGIFKLSIVKFYSLWTVVNVRKKN